MSRKIWTPPTPAIDTGRRRLLLSLGGAAAALLSGCEPSADDTVQTALKRVSRLNDAAQAALFRPQTLAPLFKRSELTLPFRFNAFYSEASVPEIDADRWRFKVEGLVRTPGEWTLKQLQALPPLTEITRLACIEGWSAIGEWTGVPLHHFLHLIGADTGAKYVAFTCADGYYTSIDMASALHPQTMLAFGFNGANDLPDEFGFPLRLRIPTKLGFKNPKHLTGMRVSNQFSSGYWEDLQGYNWFAGL
ncbi:molybdopterin-dependent oxidoreductase [Pseudoduganella sp. FT26W]|uniref:Molybdopterin-dependent oxidoreductase n=1 Tax=Duganella aquatilis TaxID=2666082 RepID=A0A844D7A9_9BURK|nr:molybdopterin-dependent oxidoreductase [Duganella aquatilis]MRW83400.1 molybdopterin-dependent oxidoreductase [Duganella aquatilis]